MTRVLLDSKKGLTFEGAGSTVFGGGFAKNSSANDQDSDDNEDPQVQQPDIHFDPVMPLPKLITVTTGEEEEDKSKSFSGCFVSLAI